MGHSAKFFFNFFLLLLFFAECFRSEHSAKFFFNFFSFPFFQKKVFISICRVYFFNTRQTTSSPSVFVLTLGKTPCLSSFFLPSVFSTALGKELVCRVPEEIHSANIKTHGKFEDSGSDRWKSSKEAVVTKMKRLERQIIGR